MAIGLMMGARGGQCAREVSVEELTIEPGLSGGGLDQVRYGEEAEAEQRQRWGTGPARGWR